MNTKNNKRRRASVERIKSAFLSLLEHKPPAHIKVADICKLAGINRSTFYANYLDVYDLADKLYSELEQEVIGLFEQKQSSDQYEADFLELFRHINTHRDKYTFYFKLGYESRHFRLPDAFDFENVIDEQMKEYHIEFFRNGLNAIIKRWLESDCHETPEQMCEILLCEYRGRFDSAGRR